MIYFFWICAFLIVYTYFIFPISIILLSKTKTLNTEFYNNIADMPTVSILIAAYNEQEVIKEKVMSIIDADFPINKIEIIIGSDCSSDNTNQIINDLALAYPFIRTLIFHERSGKSAVVNKLVSEAKNEIIILTDANIIFSKNTISALVRHFKNKQVGLIDSNMVNIGIKKSGISFQEKTYISAEVKLKHAESKMCGMLMGPFGGCFTIRKSLFKPIPKHFLVDDFFVCLHILLSGYKAINDLSAVVYEDVSNQISEEFRRKRRIAIGNFINLFYFRKLLLKPFSKLGFIFISHKVIRWFGPLFLLLLLIANYFVISEGDLYKTTFILQLFLFILPFIDLLLRKIGIHILILRFITHFYSMNLGLFMGMIDYLTTTKQGIWEPTKRKQDEI
ncbi:MAG: glycosyltransferase [Bacteroidota bacterium]|nr:glycosyltransferase [Bacteroidota bacterium]